MAGLVMAQPLILASQSPRRKDLLESAGLTFSILPSDLDESGISANDPLTLASKLAEFKAREISHDNPDAWVLGADTIVTIDDIILGKPADETACKKMLYALSGRAHSVITGISLQNWSQRISISRIASTSVTFKRLSDAEINWYSATDEPYDKAGGYAIQGLAAQFVSGIEGSYTNVVGLPLYETVKLLCEHDVARWTE